jgi:hypothetical protein
MPERKPSEGNTAYILRYDRWEKSHRATACFVERLAHDGIDLSRKTAFMADWL